MSGKIELSPDDMIVSETNLKGNIIFANADFCKIAGYKLDELVGKPHNMVRHADMPKAAFADLWKTVQKGEIWNGIVKNRTKLGDYYWVNATVYLSKNNEGESRYISVRIKPTDEEIQNAINLYKGLKQKQKNRY